MRHCMFYTAFTVFSFIAFNATAQSTEAIILIDGKPTEVMMNSEGEIEYIIREVSSYMSNFEKADQNHFISKDQTKTTEYLNTAYKVIYFLPNQALLSNATIAKLDEVASEALSSNALIMLQTVYSESHSGSRKLSKNRISACKSYLKMKGIAEGRLVEAIESKSKPSAKVNVFLK